MVGYYWVRIKRVTENSKDVRGLDTKSLRRGEEKRLWPIAFISTNTKEQPLGRILLSRNYGEPHSRFPCPLCFPGNTALKGHFPPLHSTRFSPYLYIPGHAYY